MMVLYKISDELSLENLKKALEGPQAYKLIVYLLYSTALELCMARAHCNVWHTPTTTHVFLNTRKSHLHAYIS